MMEQIISTVIVIGCLLTTMFGVHLYIKKKEVGVGEN